MTYINFRLPYTSHCDGKRSFLSLVGYLCVFVACSLKEDG